MTRIPEYKRGTLDGVRWAITWLHARAKEMRDPHATLILNSAAFNMGVASRSLQFVDSGSESEPPHPQEEDRRT